MSFTQDIARGAMGEEQALTILKGHGYTDIEDVRSNPVYQKKDIDFIVHIPPIFDITVEVKHDVVMAESKKIFAESVSNTETGRAGWLHYCEADYMMYHDAINHTFHIFKPEELREHINLFGSLYKYATAPDYKDGKVIKHSRGYCIPVSELPKIGYYRKINY